MTAALPQDRMSKLQVGVVTAAFAEADMLTNYIEHYICGRKFTMRDQREQCKAVSYLTQFMHSTIPTLIKKLKAGNRKATGESLNLEDQSQMDSTQATIRSASINQPEEVKIPGGSFWKLLACLLCIVRESEDIYNCRYYTNSDETLTKLLRHNFENFG